MNPPELLREAVRRIPTDPDAWNRLGLAFETVDQPDRAVDAFRRAVALDPQRPELRNNLGLALQELGWVAEARDQFRAACRFAYAHCNLGITSLLLGDLETGWREYEWRLHTGEVDALLGGVSAWDGRVTSDTVYVHAEQGLGDTIQLVRYLPLVRERVGRLVFICHAALVGLLRDCKGIDEIIPSEGASILKAGRHPAISLMSLPGLFSPSESAIPAQLPYVPVLDGRVQEWRRRLGGGPRMNVGVAWAGNPSHKRDSKRSCGVAEMASLASVEGIRLHSLQVGPHAADARSTGIIDHSAELTDFTQTAGLMSALDLVVSVDTAVAHLAGALGKPVWTLLPFAPDWRWMLNREDTPWYPTMRLFRQSSPGDWESVFARVRTETTPHSKGLFRND